LLPDVLLPEAPLSTNPPISCNHGQVNWAKFLTNTSLLPLVTNPAGTILNPSQLKPAMDWDMVGPAFHNADTVKNEHELNPSRIPDAL